MAKTTLPPTSTAKPAGYQRISIDAARRACKAPGSYVHWRPNANLPEKEQYALVYAKGRIS